jgi:hypothetical protein
MKTFLIVLVLAFGTGCLTKSRCSQKIAAAQWETTGACINSLKYVASECDARLKAKALVKSSVK